MKKKYIKPIVLVELIQCESCIVTSSSSISVGGDEDNQNTPLIDEWSYDGGSGNQIDL